LAGLKVLTRQQLVTSAVFCRACSALMNCGLGLDGATGPGEPHPYRLRGTVRGMHYQLPPHAEMKLVTCLRGEVWDVALDLRHGSPTFLQWHAEVLSGSNGQAMLIPRDSPWLASLSDDVDMLYCHSAAYAGQFEAGLNPLDPRLGLAWPLAIQDLSARDRAHPLLNDDFEGVRL